MKQESFGRKLFSLVLPMALQNLLSALVSASDALMLGLLDQPSLSAVSLAGQVSFVMSLFHMAFAIGATVLAAQYWGKKDAAAVEQVAGIALRASMLVSAVFFLLALLAPQALIFCAGGDTRFGLKCDAITMWGVIVPVSLIAAFVLKGPVPAVYFLLNLDEFIKLPAVWRHYRRCGWVKNLTRETQEETSHESY